MSEKCPKCGAPEFASSINRTVVSFGCRSITKDGEMFDQSDKCTITELRQTIALKDKEIAELMEATEIVNLCEHIFEAQRIASVETFGHYKLMAHRMMVEHIRPFMEKLRASTLLQPKGEKENE